MPRNKKYNPKNSRNVKLTCRFHPNKILGEIDLPTSVWPKTGKITMSELGIEDMRCDACNVEHGRYTDMEDRAKQKGLNHIQFIQVMKKANFSIKMFNQYFQEALDKKRAIIT